MTTHTVTPRSRQFAFTFGPATTAGIELDRATAPTTMNALKPESGLENVLTFQGKPVVGLGGDRFSPALNGSKRLSAIRDQVELMGSATIEVEG